MLPLVTITIRCVQPLQYSLQTNIWRNRLVSLAGQQHRWKSDEIRSYKAAILEEFNQKLLVESIRNRTKLGDGMVKMFCS